MPKTKLLKLLIFIFSTILILPAIFIVKKNIIDYGNGTEDLVIDTGKVYASGSYDYKSIVINGGVVTIDSPDGENGKLILRAKEKIILKDGGEINLSKKGYPGLEPENKTTNTGLVFDLAGGGGSHGGLGGSGSCAKKENTKIYGAENLNESFGEGGGIGKDANKGKGGAGGGFIELVAPEITIDGKIISNGEEGLETGGGGAGGKIILLSRKITLNGSIEATGGTGGTSLFQGAGGGGGGVVMSNISLNTAGINVNGGSGGKAIDYYSGCAGINGEKGEIILNKKR